MARQIKPWLAGLIESEVESVIAWTTIIKQEPGTTRVDDRFEDDGSNFRCTVTSPPFSEDTKVQILKTPESRREPALVTDGEVQVKAKLSKAAWDSYEDALDGEDSMRGDILTCTGITICSTPFGPPDERVLLVLTGVEFKGDNVRKTIGTPSPIEQRPRIEQLLNDVARLRARQNNDGWPEEKEGGDLDEAMPDADPFPPEQDSGPSGSISEFQHAVETQVRQESTRPPPDSQPPALEVPISSHNFPTLASRRGRGRGRGRGGYSLAHDGIEATRGVNLAIPQAPGLAASKRKLDDLLDVRPKPTNTALPRAQSTPASAQVLPDETVVDTPARSANVRKRESSGPVSSVGASGRPAVRRRKPQRVAAAQLALLGKKNSWFPPEPGHRFPTPNIPISFLEKWNSRPQNLSQPVPRMLFEANSEPDDSDGSDDSETASDARPGADANNELEEGSASDSDAPLSGWSASPSQGSRLPPDSSADSPLKRPTRPKAAAPSPRNLECEEMRGYDESRPGTSYSNNSSRRSNASPLKGRHQPQTPVNGTPQGTHSWNGQLQTLPNPSPRHQLPPKPPLSSRMQPADYSNGLTSRPASQVTNFPGSQQMSQQRKRKDADITSFSDMRLSSPPRSYNERPARGSLQGGFMRPPAAAIKHDGRGRRDERRNGERMNDGRKNDDGRNDGSRLDDRVNGGRRPDNRTNDGRMNDGMMNDERRRMIEMSQDADQRRPPSSSHAENFTSTDPRWTQYRPSQDEANARPTRNSRPPRHDSHPHRPNNSQDFSRPPPTAPRADRARASQDSTHQGDEIEMETDVPRALDANYQNTRREFFTASGRRRWIEAKLSPPFDRNIHLGSLLQSYHTAKPLDPVSSADFLRAIKTIYPDAVAWITEQTEATPEKASSKASASPTPEPAREQPATTKASVQATSLATERIAPRFPTLPPTSKGTRTAKPTQTRETSALPLPQHSKEAPPKKPPPPSAAQGTTTAKPTRATEKQPSTTRAETLDQQAQQLSVFEEFALRWRSSQPEGAFAKEVARPEGGRMGGRGLDVLAWGFGC